MAIFYILVFTLPMPNHPILATHIGPLTVLKCLGITCLLATFFEMLRTGTCPPFSGQVKARWFLIYVLVALASGFFHDGLLTFSSDPFMYTVSTFSLFIVTTTMVGNLKRLRWAILVAEGSVAWGSLYVIRQWQQYRNVFPGFRTWGGLAGDPNYYAVTVVLSMPLLACWLMLDRPKWEKRFCVVCLIVTSVAFFFAASRGGFIGLAVGGTFLIFNSRHRVRNFVLVVLLVIPVVLFSGASVFDRLLHPNASDEESSQFRLELWEAAENTFVEHPLVGVGMGHYQPAVIRNGTVVVLPFHVAHNTYMELIADLGLAGLISFLAILIGSLVNLWRISRRTKEAGQLLLYRVALGLQAGLLGYMVCAFFLSTLWQQVFWFSVFLSMCLSVVESSMAVKVAAEPSPQKLGIRRGKRSPDKLMPVGIRASRPHSSSSAIGLPCRRFLK
jgi:O-antigen ligase